MSTAKNPLYTRAILATAVLTANRFTTLAGAVTAAAARSPGGVCTRNAAIGEYAPCDLAGTTTIEAGAGIALGAQIEVGANGKGVTKAAGVAVAVALEVANADGDLIEVQLTPS